MTDFRSYECSECGTAAELLYEGAGALVCCGKEMVELQAGTKDAALEKHVPEVTREGNQVHVQVGSVEHPMTDKHYIVFIAVVQGNKVQRVNLQPGETPKADFVVEDGPIVVYEYCNLHGLWKTEA